MSVTQEASAAEEAEPLPSRAAAALQALLYSPRARSPVCGAGEAGEAAGLLAEAEEGAEEEEGGRAALLRRLRTFRPGLWPGRPESCDALAAARRGWAAVAGEPELLACGCCGARLAFSPPPGPAEAAAAFAPKLATAHRAECRWAGEARAAEAALCAFPPLPSEQLAAAYAQRLSALQALPALPATADAPREARLARLASAQAPAEEGEAAPPAVAAQRAAAAAAAARIALCGWQARGGALRCPACAAAVGLWNFAQAGPPAADAAAYARLAREARLRALSAPARAGAGAGAGGAAAGATLALRAVGGGWGSAGGGTIAGGAPVAAAAGGAGPFGRKRTAEAAGVAEPPEPPAPAPPAPPPAASAAAEGPFDPVAAHRPFCPWVRGWATESGPLPPGWQRTLDALSPAEAAAPRRVAEGGGGAAAAALTPAAARLLVGQLLRGTKTP